MTTKSYEITRKYIVSANDLAEVRERLATSQNAFAYSVSEDGQSDARCACFASAWHFLLISDFTAEMQIVIIAASMPHFTRDHIFLLPHAEEYRRFFAVSVKQVLDCLNAPEVNVGRNTGPLSARSGEVYAIVDFVGCTEVMPDAIEAADLPAGRQGHPASANTPSNL